VVNPTQPHNIEQVINLLRDQVDQMQIDLGKQKKPWYQKISGILSIASIVISIANTAIYTPILQHNQDIYNKRKELRELISSISDTRSDIDKLSLIKDKETRTITDKNLFAKRQLYIESAESLVKDIPNQVNSRQYLVLAVEKGNDGDSKQAENYYLAAVKKAEDGSLLEKNVALRAIGYFYFENTPSKSIGNARDYLRRAVEIIKDESADSTLNYTKGLTYELWGDYERSNGFPTEAIDKYQQAEHYYKLAEKSDELASVNQKLKQIIESPSK
jgi:tetratricopeptide (TPR) repeat protein